MILIGLTGPAGCGKDTVAQFLRDEFGFYICSFAAPLKVEVAKAYGLTGDSVSWLEERENKERPLLRLALEECDDPGFIDCVAHRAQAGRDQVIELKAKRSWRWVLQRWGTEYRRGQSPTYWIDRATEAVASRERVVFTDTRFPNEAEFIRTDGGTLWHIERPGIPAVEAHVSNQRLAVEPGDFVLLNDGTISDLADEVKILLRSRYYAAYRTGE